MTMTLNLTPGTLPTGDRGLIAKYRQLFRPAQTKDGGPRGPQPGDVLYWMTCVGAVCLLLLAAN